MTSGRVHFLVLMLIIGPPAGVFLWHQGNIYMELQAIPPEQLPGHVVMVYSPSCGACKRMLPIVHQVQSEGYRIRTANVGNDRSVGDQWNVRGLPTLIYFENGQEKFRTVGSMSGQRLRDFCRGIYL